MKRFFPAVIAATCVFAAAPSASADSLDEKIDKALAFAEVQVESLAQRTGPTRFPCYR